MTDGEQVLGVQPFVGARRRWGVMESSNLAAAFGESLARDAGVESVSFDDFFVVEHEAMVRLATSLVDTRERAEEIVQDAFEKALLAWQRLDEPGAYLRASVVNGCRSELRRRRVIRKHSRPERPGVVAAEDAYLLDALSKLTPQRRIAITLRFYADLPEAEIARLMNVRLGTVKSLVSRGLADLRKVVAR